ncbi:phage tail tape measure protein [Pandoraea pnomenusa]|uniref:phage tail tape measure protein n=1 Tax=Pandoraea pnomenusa TaxID=93220 RepID=UPI001146EC08|nr:phage tail tape measure protein [Pandoraea pnomenusa]QDH59489.1 phage tail tape measure protein [Pandoraea pnomenusa]
MTIGTITVDLLAKTGSFETDVNRAAKLAEKRAKEIDAAFARLGVGIGLGLTAAGGAAVLIGKNAIDQLAALDDAAQKTGASVENLSKIQQSTMAFNHNFDEVDSAISRLAKGMATVDDESNKTNKALAALGVSAKDAGGSLRDPAQVLIDVAKSLQNYQDGAAKTALVTDLFGKSGANLLPVLNDMADSVDSFTGATKESAAQAAAFQDNVSKLTGQLKTLAQEVVSDVLPTLNSLFDTLQNIRKTSLTGWLLSDGAENDDPGKRLREIGAQLDTLREQRDALDPSKGARNKINEFLFGDFRSVTAQITLLEKQQSYLKARQQTLALAGGGGSDQVDRMVNGAKPVLDYTSGREKAPKEAKDKKSEADRYIESLQKQVITVQTLTSAEEALAMIQSGRLGTVTQAQKDQILTAATLVDLAKDGVEQERQRQELISKGKKVYEETLSPFERMQKDYQELNVLLQGGFIDAQTYERAVTQVQKKFDELTDKSKEAQSELDEFAKSAAQNIQSSFAEFLFDPFKDGLDGMLKGFLDFLRRAVANAAAANLSQALFGGLSGGGIGGGLLGAAFTGILGAYGDATGTTVGGVYGPQTQAGLDDLISQVSMRASGGPVSAGEPYIVGEKRAELFVPNTSGTILPSVPSAGGMSVSVVTNVDNSGNATSKSAGDSDRTGRQLSQVIRSAVVDEISRQQRQGGLLWRARTGGG